jgi:hypothetical protein
MLESASEAADAETRRLDGVEMQQADKILHGQCRPSDANVFRQKEIYDHMK